MMPTSNPYLPISMESPYDIALGTGNTGVSTTYLPISMESSYDILGIGNTGVSPTKTDSNATISTGTSTGSSSGSSSGTKGATGSTGGKGIKGFRKNIVDFITSKTGTILAQATGICLGIAFKDVVMALVNSIFEPIFCFIIILCGLRNVPIFSDFISSQNNPLNFSKLITAIITAWLVVISAYYLYKHTEYVAGS